MKSLGSRETALLCVRYALEKKAYDLVVMDVGQCASFAEYFVICSGRSDTQVQAIARGIEENLDRLGVRPLSVEGYSLGHWVLLDYADVVVHVFFQPVREYYDLERLWGHAPRLALPEPYRTQARELRLAGQG
ncbi:MAG: ribosomal silencing factor RsfS [Candidatus Binatia bacterium]|nr:MAG: ribosomal silencing factor RsfS [Candidatus Binatia bacterium]